MRPETYKYERLTENLFPKSDVTTGNGFEEKGHHYVLTMVLLAITSSSSRIQLPATVLTEVPLYIKCVLSQSRAQPPPPCLPAGPAAGRYWGGSHGALGHRRRPDADVRVRE